MLLGTLLLCTFLLPLGGSKEGVPVGPWGESPVGFFMRTQKEPAPSSHLRPRNSVAQREMCWGGSDSKEECIQVVMFPTLYTKL